MLTVYLYIALGALIIMKTAVLHDQGIDFVPWGVAIVKAAVLAKFMLIGDAMHIGNRYSDRPLIWPTLYKAFAFLVLLVVLTIIEQVVIGYFHHQSAVASIAELAGPRLNELLASVVIMWVVLLPYCAFRVLSEAVGEGRLERLFFVAHEKLPVSEAGHLKTP